MQLLQLEITKSVQKEYLERELVRFVQELKVKHEKDIEWKNWRDRNDVPNE